MEDTKSVIVYERMNITPALLKYLRFGDITEKINGLKGGCEKVYLHEDLEVVVYFEPLQKKCHTSILRRYPLRSYFHVEAGLLTLLSLIEYLVEVQRQKAYNDGHAEGYMEGYDQGYSGTAYSQGYEEGYEQALVNWGNK